MNLEIGISSVKKTHIITSYKIFGLLEDIGGFMGAL
jgi:hypothetical protein